MQNTHPLPVLLMRSEPARSAQRQFADGAHAGGVFLVITIRMGTQTRTHPSLRSC